MNVQVGVDLGTTEVRVVEVAGLDAEGFAQVRRIGREPVSVDAIVAGRIRKPEDVARALARAFAASGIKRGTPLIAGISTPDVGLARTELPPGLSAPERLSALRLAARPVSPTLPLEVSALGTNVIRTTTTGEGGQVDSVVAAAALKEQVDLLDRVFNRAKLTLRAVDLAPAATMRAVSRTNGSEFEVATVVDMGASKTAIVTRQGRHLRSLRVVPIGGQEITQAIIQATGVGFEEAESQKAMLRLSDAPTSQMVDLDMGYGLEESPSGPSTQTRVEEVLALAVDPIIEAIASSIENDHANYSSFTQAVTLCGGSAQLRGFREMLQSRLGIPVIVGGPWAALSQKGNEAYFTGGVEDPVLMLTLATAIGLATWTET